MDVSKNRGGPPKWMVRIMENPIKIDDLGVPLFLETPKCLVVVFITNQQKKDLPTLAPTKKALVRVVRRGICLTGHHT